MGMVDRNLSEDPPNWQPENAGNDAEFGAGSRQDGQIEISSTFSKKSRIPPFQRIAAIRPGKDRHLISWWGHFDPRHRLTHHPPQNMVATTDSPSTESRLRGEFPDSFWDDLPEEPLEDRVHLLDSRETIDGRLRERISPQLPSWDWFSSLLSANLDRDRRAQFGEARLRKGRHHSPTDLRPNAPSRMNDSSTPPLSTTGSAEALVEAAVTEFEGPLTGYVAGLLSGDWESARDVVQDVFVKLYKQDPETIQDRLKSWLYTVARNRAIDIIRKNKPMTVTSHETFETLDDQRPDRPAGPRPDEHEQFLAP